MQLLKKFRLFWLFSFIVEHKSAMPYEHQIFVKKII